MEGRGPSSCARWRRRKEARPAEILAAALASFAERGFAATRLEDVAARAGVTKGTHALSLLPQQGRAVQSGGAAVAGAEHR
ncbi:MAG TPA: helix-turn-helix domain-containing protein, partial [Stellaceae bacterium]|nr:helix-turn-helix domain-containing protein [Stellaceae bacterium]